jgi:hypothetical protein
MAATATVLATICLTDWKMQKCALHKSPNQTTLPGAQEQIKKK